MSVTSEPTMFCRSCSYVLNGLDNTCPECGSPFDKNNPATWKPTDPSSRIVASSLTLLVMFWHCLTVVAGGHGIGVVGMGYFDLFRFSYNNDYSLVVVLVGWGAIILSFATAVLRSSWARRIALCGLLVLLAIVEVYCIAMSELGVFTLVSSIPFWISALVAAWVVAFKWPRK